MAFVTLTDSDDWTLKFASQDVRGHAALDAKGERLGTVHSMIVDTDAERISAITLKDGRRYPAEDMSIGDGEVFLTTINPKGQPSTVQTHTTTDIK